MVFSFIKRIGPFLGIAFFIAASTIVFIELKHFKYTDFVSALANTPISIIGLGVALTIINYLTLSGYDILALKYLQKKLPIRQVMLASIIGFSVSNNTGHALVAGPSVRYRFYKNWGLSVVDLMRLSVFNSFMYLLGALTLAPIAYFLLPHQDKLQSTMHHVIQVVMFSAIVGVVLYWSLIFLRRKPFDIKGVSIAMPGPMMTLAQTMVAGLDLILASLVLYVFLQHTADISFTTFLVVFLVAQAVGLYSQVPGGVGVFEGVFMYMVGDTVASHDLFVGLILFRIIYYFIPLLLAGASMLAFEYMHNHQVLKQKAINVARTLDGSVTQIFSYILLVTGAVLLFSNVTPISTQALTWMSKNVALTILESSHFLSSLIGVMLIILSRAIRQRINAAYFATLILLLSGVLLSILKGGDWWTASILGCVFLLMLPTKPYFYRESKLIDAAYSRSWFAMIILVLAIALWLGFFSYKHIEYKDELWWQFAFNGDASRFLRALIGSASLLFVFFLLRLFRSPVSKLNKPTVDDLDQAQLVVSQSNDLNGSLSLLGDKYLLWSDNKRAFLMYGVTPNYWVIMSDPIGTESEQENLLWKIREKADKKGAKIVCYQVSKGNLAQYLDMGLILIKFGEEGKVDLHKFTLEGNARSKLRQTYNKLKRIPELSFEVLDQQSVKEYILELNAVSDDWLDEKSAKEKQFSLGFFERNYIARTRVAVVKKAGEIVAFANLWELENKHELSFDLMRFNKNAPSSVMEWLTISVMLWGKEQGFYWFNLGMAPLYGLEKHELAPLWHKLGNTIFEHGTDLYNFEGLHAYKDKFDPVWESRYVAIPNKLGVLPALLAVTKLISGGSLIGTLKK